MLPNVAAFDSSSDFVLVPTVKALEPNEVGLKESDAAAAAVLWLGLSALPKGVGALADRGGYADSALDFGASTLEAKSIFANGFVFV